MLTVRLLGQFALHQDDQPVEMVSRPAQSLFAYLILSAGTTFRREKLAGLFWPDSSETNARSNLRGALWRIRQAIGEGYLQADKLTVTFTPEAKYWLDANVLTDAVTQDASVAALVASVTVYEGELLPGFYEEWALLERERLRTVYDQRMQQLLDKLAELKQWPDTLTWAERWIATGHVPEPAYRALMVAHTALGDQASVAAVFQRCVEALYQELGVEPSAETHELYRRLSQNRDLSTESVKITDSRERDATFISGQEKFVQAEDTIFVGRESQLTQLDIFLGNALNGQGQVAMVTGGAGRGKTSLLKAFARRANSKHAELTVASGQCHAYTGVGDPFLPFLDVMRMLTGTKEAEWIAAALTQEHAFEQYVGILNGLAAQRPLLIILDDLQWADDASINLLFHLSRRIVSKPILIVGAYRPDEVALGRDGKRHPLAKVLGELKRHFGDISVELAQASEGNEGQEFVNALLDSEPNQLDEAFRQALFRQTGGHPLFTIELLREMQERDDLVQNEAGQWVEGANLNWWLLPAQVEGVLAERISRLEPNLRELLAVASIEGEFFTAEVVARVQEISQRQVLRQLAQASGKRHRLVREGEEIQVGRQLLSRYQFTHILFQRYLYDSLSAGERRLLHGEIAHTLEAIYEGRRGEIAAQLLHHFRGTGEREKAVKYARRAAHRAKALYAYDEAIQHLKTALDLLEVEKQAEMRLALLEELADIHGLFRDDASVAISLYLAALEQWSNIEGADAMTEIRLHRKIIELAYVLRDLFEFRPLGSLSPTVAKSHTYLENRYAATDGKIEHLEWVHVLTVLANNTLSSGDQTHLSPILNKAESYAQAAVDLAEQLDAVVELTIALQALASIYFVRQELSQQLAISRRRLALSRDPRFDDVHQEITILEDLSNVLIQAGEYAQALSYLLETEQMASEMKLEDQEMWSLNFQAECLYRLDRWQEILAVDKRRQAMERRYARDMIQVSCVATAYTAATLALRGDFDQASIMRQFSFATMERFTGPAETWGVGQHY